MRLALRSLLASAALVAPAAVYAQGFPLVPITGQRAGLHRRHGEGPDRTRARVVCVPQRRSDELPAGFEHGRRARPRRLLHRLLATTWGWTDPQTGREYAILGRSDGTAFVDVTDPVAPVYLGLMPRPGSRTNAPGSPVSASLWKELKVLGNTVVVVSEASGHGMQTFDLTRLRGVTAPQVFSETGRYTGFGKAHNVLVSEASNTAVATGFASDGTPRQAGCGQGLEFVNIANPAAPTFVGCFNGPSVNGSRGYTHDAQCVTYRGPDTRFTGREICLLSDEKVIHIVDATNKASFQVLGSATYPNVGYAHQGWLSDDHRTFYFDDEFDETNGVTSSRTRTLLLDVARLDAPTFAGTYAGRSSAIDHNQYVRGRLLFQANYTAGIAILDVTTPLTPTEAGFFDTYPGQRQRGLRRRVERLPVLPQRHRGGGRHPRGAVRAPPHGRRRHGLARRPASHGRVAAPRRAKPRGHRDRC